MAENTLDTLDTFDEVENDFCEFADKLKTKRLSEVVRRLAPLFELSATRIRRRNDFPKEILVEIFTDNEYAWQLVDAEMSGNKDNLNVSNYLLGGQTGLYLAKKKKPSLDKLAETLQKQFLVMDRNFPGVDKRVRLYGLMTAPLERYFNFIKHYCGLLYEGGDVSLHEERIVCSKIDSGNLYTGDDLVDALTTLTIASQAEWRLPMIAAEHFLNEEPAAEFTKVVSLDLVDALFHIDKKAKVSLCKNYQL